MPYFFLPNFSGETDGGRKANKALCFCNASQGENRLEEEDFLSVSFSSSLLLGQEGEISHVGSYALSAYVSAYIIIPGFSKISQLLIFMLCHTPGFTSRLFSGKTQKISFFIVLSKYACL